MSTRPLVVRGRGGPGRNRHLPFVVVLLAAGLVRLVTWVVYRPALMFPDSWTYLGVTFQEFPVGMSTDRPSGYPLVLRALSIPGRHLAGYTAAQHVAGVVVGLLVYSMLLRLGARRWMAVAAAALVLLDAYTVTLEQFVLSESIFALTVVAACWLLVFSRRSLVAVACSGLLLATAALIRGSGLFAIPVLLAYLVWSRGLRWRTLVTAVAAVSLPLVAYASLHAAVGRGFGFTEADGWWLYGRVGAIVDCDRFEVTDEVRPLCQPVPPELASTPGDYVWRPESPARRLFPEGPNRKNNAVLRDFAFATIGSRPLAFARTVGVDVIRAFRPGGGGVADDLHLPVEGELDRYAEDAYAQEVRTTWFPEYRPPRPTAGNVVVHYQRWLRLPRPVLGGFALLVVVGLLLRVPHRKEVFLLGGSALTMLVLSVATVEMAFRYVVPLQPLLVCAAALVASDLLARRGGTAAPRGGGELGAPTPASIRR